MMSAPVRSQPLRLTRDDHRTHPPSRSLILAMTHRIETPDLRLDHLPDPSDRQAVVEFAMSFNGYDHYGSFEACAEAAMAGDRQTLTQLRNELFFTARAARHGGDDAGSICRLYASLLPLFRHHLA